MEQLPSAIMQDKYYYIGEDNEFFICGNQYKVIATGQHWWKEYGIGAWMTNEEYPNTIDEDYGVFVPYEDFLGKRKIFVKY